MTRSIRAMRCTAPRARSPAQRKTRIDLAPLSVDAIRQLGGDHPQSAADLREITGGNPFYLTEIMNHDTRLAALPGSVADAVNARLNGLSDAQCRFLETLSLLSGAIPFDWIRQLEDRAGPIAMSRSSAGS